MSKVEEVRQNKEREEVFEATWESYRKVMEGVFALQEQTLRFARSLIEDSIEVSTDAARQQAESNLATAQALAERSDQQREALEKLLKASARAYTDLFYAPFSTYPRYRELLESMVPTAALDPASNGESHERRAEQSLPIADYDSLSVSKVSEKVESNGLSTEDLNKLRSHERANKERRTLIELFDRQIGKVSP